MEFDCYICFHSHIYFITLGGNSLFNLLRWVEKMANDATKAMVKEIMRTQDEDQN
jgi:hypothetical protein